MSNSDGRLTNVPWTVARPVCTASQGELFYGIPLETAMRMGYKEVGLTRSARSLLSYRPLGPLLRMDDGYVRFRMGQGRVYRYVYSDSTESMDTLVSVGISEEIRLGHVSDSLRMAVCHEWGLGEVRRILDGEC